MSPKRKTTGIRVPDHPVSQALLKTLENPIISTSAHLADQDDFASLDKAKLFDIFDKLVDIIVDDENDPGFETSTILDLTSQEPSVVRRGLGWEALEELVSLTI